MGYPFAGLRPDHYLYKCWKMRHWKAASAIFIGRGCVHKISKRYLNNFERAFDYISCFLPQLLGKSALSEFDILMKPTGGGQIPPSPPKNLSTNVLHYVTSSTRMYLVWSISRLIYISYIKWRDASEMSYWRRFKRDAREIYKIYNGNTTIHFGWDDLASSCQYLKWSMLLTHHNREIPQS